MALLGWVSPADDPKGTFMSIPMLPSAVCYVQSGRV